MTTVHVKDDSAVYRASIEEVLSSRLFIELGLTSFDEAKLEGLRDQACKAVDSSTWEVVEFGTPKQGDLCADTVGCVGYIACSVFEDNAEDIESLNELIGGNLFATAIVKPKEGIAVQVTPEEVRDDFSTFKEVYFEILEDESQCSDMFDAISQFEIGEGPQVDRVKESVPFGFCLRGFMVPKPGDIIAASPYSFIRVPDDFDYEDFCYDVLGKVATGLDDVPNDLLMPIVEQVESKPRFNYLNDA